MRFLRKWIYRLGGRPKPGSIWFSPSWALIKSFSDTPKQTTTKF